MTEPGPQPPSPALDGRGASSPPGPPPSGSHKRKHEGDGDEHPGVAAAARGGHLKGNFPRYYQFHTTEERVEALLGDAEARRVILLTRAAAATGAAAAAAASPPPPLLVSDWGCNSGDLTAALVRKLQGLVVAGRRVAALGIDLDEGLIQRAQETWASVAPGDDGGGLTMAFAAADVVAEEARVRRLVAEFVQEQQRGEGEERVDLLTIFSTTMWVHLAHGDEGLRRLLRFAAGLARCLVVEPQDAKSYKTARKRLRQLNLDPSRFFREASPELRTSPGLTAYLLSDACGFTHSRNIGKSSAWGRDLLLFWRETTGAAEAEAEGGAEKGTEEEGDDGGGGGKT